MGEETCTNCFLVMNETSTSFYERTKDMQDIKPFICRSCKRVNLILMHPEEYERRLQKNRNKYKQRLSRKASINEMITLCSENPIFQLQLQQRDLEARAVFREFSASIRPSRKNAEIEISSEEKKEIKKFYKFCPQGYHVDHIIPISKGGKHCLSNLQYLSVKDNFSKGNKISKRILQKHLDGEPVSNALLQRKFKLSYEEACRIMQELEA